MKKYTILYYTDFENAVYLLLPYEEGNMPTIYYPEDMAARIDDIDLYTVKQQLEAKGIDCAMIDDQIKADQKETLNLI